MYHTIQAILRYDMIRMIRMFYSTILTIMIIYIYIKNIISYHILYIIAEAERKLIPTIKEVVTNKKKDPLKCCHM